MVKGISIKEAIKKWESSTKQKASEANVIKLNGFSPPIQKLDNSLVVLQKCEKLSLSTNYIDKLIHLNVLTHLKILSIGRNLLKSLSGLECLAASLEELWASYNQIEKLKPLFHLKKLKILYLSNNGVKDAFELKYLVEASDLQNLVLVGNPMQGVLADGYRMKVSDLLRQVKILDGTAVLRAEGDETFDKMKVPAKLTPGEEPETLVETVEDPWLLNMFS